MKKLNSKGFSHVEMAIVVVVAVVIGAIGFYVYNRAQDRSSRAESIVSTEPSRVDNDTETLSKLTTAQATEADRTYTKVIDDVNIGQVFACKLTPNFRDGVKYYFNGQVAKQMWANWGVGNPDRPNMGGAGRSGRLQAANTVKLYKVPGTFSPAMVLDWRFSLKNASNNRLDSAWLPHKDLNRCP